MSDAELTPQELEELGLILRRVAGQPNELEAPPAHVWQSIESELQTEPPIAAAQTIAKSDSPRSARLAKYMLAAAVLAIAAIGLGSLLNNKPTETILAVAEISNEGMPLELPASGTANLVSVDGILRLDLHVEQLETDTGYFELWVARPDASAVESLGAIDGDGSFDWPEGFDPEDFSAVAISLEEHDGDPSFSGIAVLFGVLDL